MTYAYDADMVEGSHFKLVVYDFKTWDIVNQVEYENQAVNCVFCDQPYVFVGLETCSP